jgi:hypothetical protein
MLLGLPFLLLTEYSGVECLKKAGEAVSIFFSYTLAIIWVFLNSLWLIPLQLAWFLVALVASPVLVPLLSGCNSDVMGYFNNLFTCRVDLFEDHSFPNLYFFLPCVSLIIVASMIFPNNDD